MRLRQPSVPDGSQMEEPERLRRRYGEVVCPAKRSLTQSCRVVKRVVGDRRRKAQAAAKAAQAAVKKEG